MQRFRYPKELFSFSCVEKCIWKVKWNEGNPLACKHSVQHHRSDFDWRPLCLLGWVWSARSASAPSWFTYEEHLQAWKMFTCVGDSSSSTYSLQLLHWTVLGLLLEGSNCGCMRGAQGEHSWSVVLSPIFSSSLITPPLPCCVSVMPRGSKNKILIGGSRGRAEASMERFFIQTRYLWKYHFGTNKPTFQLHALFLHLLVTSDVKYWQSYKLGFPPPILNYVTNRVVFPPGL